MRRHPLPAAAILLALIVPFRAAAIPPPDFLIAVGSSFGQIFSLVVVLASGLFAAAVQTVRAYRPRFHFRAWQAVAGVVALVLFSTGIAWTVDQRWQQEEIARTITRQMENASPEPKPTLPVADASYFHEHESDPLDISNEEFAALASTSPYVLDAREDEEVEIGRYPGSVHARLADLLDGAYANIPRDRTVYVFCWSGIRGAEVATFLRSHGIVARYVKDGADGWVSFGGAWDGGIKFSSKYTEARYVTTVSEEDVRGATADGAVLVDARDAERIAKKPLAGSVAISAIFTPTSKLEEAFSLVPAGRDIIAVCDDFVSCFDAKIVGIRLEKRGHPFLGRYVY